MKQKKHKRSISPAELILHILESQPFADFYRGMLDDYIKGFPDAAHKTEVLDEIKSLFDVETKEPERPSERAMRLSQRQEFRLYCTICRTTRMVQGDPDNPPKQYCCRKEMVERKKK